MYLLFLWRGTYSNGFEEVQHQYEGLLKGWALKIETFLGPEMARAKPKKVNRHKNNWYIGSFMYPCAVV